MDYVFSATGRFPSTVSIALRPHLHQIAVALALTLLAIFGDDINRAVSGLIRKRAFLVRVSVFIVLVAFGYGVAGLAITSVFARILMLVDNRFLAPLVIVCFVLVGVLAEQKGHI